MFKYIFIVALAAAISATYARADTNVAIVYTFTGGADGGNPLGVLVADNSGVLYGATSGGGLWGFGTVFRFRPKISQFQVLYSFTGGADGGSPNGKLALDGSGRIYGTTFRGGAANAGSVFMLTPQNGMGSWTETVLQNFAGGNADGASPYAGITLDDAGSLYGTTVYGGPSNSGTVFRLTPPNVPGGAWSETILHSFDGTDGASPYGEVILDHNGTLYGTASAGGNSPCRGGTIFRLTPSETSQWTETTIHDFSCLPDGQTPYAGLIFDRGGFLYGTTYWGGTQNGGTVFQITPPRQSGGAWSTKIITNFGSYVQLFQADGIYPFGSVIIDRRGEFYGTTQGGGSLECSFGCGTIFTLTRPQENNGIWRRNTIYNFTGADNANPDAGLTANGSGALYGVTNGDMNGAPSPNGHVNYFGSIYKLAR